jgi:hypothetical protein
VALGHRTEIIKADGERGTSCGSCLPHITYFRWRMTEGCIQWRIDNDALGVPLASLLSDDNCFLLQVNAV